jgi:hypothetical protein
MTLRGWALPARDDEEPDQFAARRVMQGPPARTNERMAVCPACLAEDAAPYVRRLWALGWIAICPRHSTVLATICPTCSAQLPVPNLTSTAPFLPGRRGRCGALLRGKHVAHPFARRLQTRLLVGKRRGWTILPGAGRVDWPLAVHVVDGLARAVWSAPKPVRTDILQHVAESVGVPSLADDVRPRQHSTKTVMTACWFSRGCSSAILSAPMAFIASATSCVGQR